MKHISFIIGLVCVTSLVAWNLPAAAASEKPAAADLAGGFSGKVIETMNAGDYTYVQVETGGKKVWAAAPKFSVKVGDTASIPKGMAMQNYHSKILNRDFDVVYFTDRVVVNGQQGETGVQLPKNHPSIHGGAPKPSEPVNLKGINKAEGGRTVAEIYKDASKLAGQPVTVRGKVVKYNGGIMGKNWIHLRDGTGTDGKNDLLVTSTAEAKVGDTVLATGKLALNKDFGANYKYPVMLEDANIKVE